MKRIIINYVLEKTVPAVFVFFQANTSNETNSVIIHIICCWVFNRLPISVTENRIDKMKRNVPNLD